MPTWPRLSDSRFGEIPSSRDEEDLRRRGDLPGRLRKIPSGMSNRHRRDGLKGRTREAERDRRERASNHAPVRVQGGWGRGKRTQVRVEAQTSTRVDGGVCNETWVQTIVERSKPSCPAKQVDKCSATSCNDSDAPSSSRTRLHRPAKSRFQRSSSLDTYRLFMERGA